MSSIAVDIAMNKLLDEAFEQRRRLIRVSRTGPRCVEDMQLMQSCCGIVIGLLCRREKQTTRPDRHGATPTNN